MFTRSTNYRKVAALLASAVLLAGIAGCGNASDNAKPPSGDTGATSSKTGEVTKIEASYAESYDSYDAMAKAADLVVDGEIVKATGTTEVGGVPATYYEVLVHSVAMKTGTAPKTVTVLQTGGVKDGQTFQVEGDPLLRPGDRELLYLKRGADDPNVFYTLAGPSGRLAISETGKLSKIGDSALTGVPATGEQALENVVAQVDGATMAIVD